MTMLPIVRMGGGAVLAIGIAAGSIAIVGAAIIWLATASLGQCRVLRGWFHGGRLRATLG